MESIPISIEGFDCVKKELERLKKERPAIIQAIAEAREEGDLKENGGYHAARERQGLLEARITYIKSRMPFFNVVDVNEMGGDRVIFGATVELEDLDTGEERTYTLMGPDETDFAEGGLSALSPVGRALIGKEEGDEILVDVPKGKIEFEILSINFNGPYIKKK